MTEAVDREIIDRLLRLYDSIDRLEVDARHQRVALVAHGWYTAVRRTSQAIVQLADAGYEFEAAPLRRSLIEHVIALRWLGGATDDAVTSILRGHQRQLERLRASTRQAGWPVAEDDAWDIVLGVDPGASSEDRNLHFLQRCREYGTNDVYAAWQAETNNSHPSFSTASAYLNPHEDLQQTELSDHPVNFPAGMLGVVSWGLLLAREAFNELIKDEPWTAELAELGERLIAARAS